jgi:hypothetical protein
MSVGRSRPAEDGRFSVLLRIVDRLEIEALVTEFAYRIDHGFSDRVADLFAPQGWYGREGGTKSVGRDAIRAAYAGRRSESPARLSRHLFANLRVAFDGEDGANGLSTLMLIAGDGAAPLPVNVTLVQDYVDRYVRIDGSWLFLARETRRLFIDDGFREVLKLGAGG